MAHADYHCCAVCDSKQEYGGDNSTTKEKICPGCLKDLRRQDLSILDVPELINWIRGTDIVKVRRILRNIGFRFCFYSNDVDDAVRAKGIDMESGSRVVAMK